MMDACWDVPEKSRDLGNVECIKSEDEIVIIFITCLMKTCGRV